MAENGYLDTTERLYFEKTLNSLSPSMHADLINSIGNNFVFCLNKYIVKGNVIESITIVSNEFSNSIFCIIMNNGIIVTVEGIRIEKNERIS